MNRTGKHYTDKVTRFRMKLSHVFTNMWVLELNFQLHEFNLEVDAKSSKLKESHCWGEGRKLLNEGR